MSKRGMKSLALLGAAAVAVGGAGSIMSGFASPAAAASVSGCAQGWTQLRGVCIRVDTGQTNGRDHTQMVNSITVIAPWGGVGSKMEAWAGNGPTGVAWYASTNNSTYITWNVGRWIKNGSGICGSYTYPGTSNRSIACITIRA